MTSFLFPLLALQASTPAHAGYFSVAMRIPHTAPDASGPRFILRHLGEVATGYADQTIASDWPYLTCEIKNQSLVVVFQADPADWPTTVPSSATCVAPDDTLTITIFDDVSPDPLGGSLDLPATGVEIAAHPHDAVVRSYRMSTALDLVPGDTSAQLQGGTWAGVYCQVAYNSAQVPWLNVDIAQDSVAGSGQCVLDRVDGGTELVDLGLSR